MRTAPVVAAVLLAVLVAGVGQAAALSPELAKTVEAANKEGELRVVWGTALGGVTGARVIQDHMQRQLGTTFPVRYAPGPSMTQSAMKAMTEFLAGQPASSDVLITAGPSVAEGNAPKMYRAVDWKSLLPGRVTDEMIEGDGTVLRFASYVSGVTYNTTLIANPPRTLAGYLDPSLKGKLASTPEATAFDIMSMPDFLGHDKTIQYATALSRQLGGLIRCAELSRVAAGEFGALIMDCGAGSALELQTKGAPVDQLILTDFVQLQFFYFAIPQNAVHPNAATAFIAYVMSEQGQVDSWDLWKEDLHLFPGSHMAARIATATGQGAVPTVLDFAWGARHSSRELEKARSEVLKILREGAE